MRSSTGRRLGYSAGTSAFEFRLERDVTTTSPRRMSNKHRSNVALDKTNPEPADTFYQVVERLHTGASKTNRVWYNDVRVVLSLFVLRTASLVSPESLRAI
eukprot:PhF_6_TR11566/c0_g1_i1/m.18652